MEIPVIDIFAGPGGLGEGFSAFCHKEATNSIFKIALSIEKDKHAHQTLTLRSFFRQFPNGQVPVDYYEFIKGRISMDDLFDKWPNQADNASSEAWRAELGDDKKATPSSIVDERIISALNGERDWLLIGGPPCQAYSIVGRSRRQEQLLDERKDSRVGLYKQYLRVLAVHNPAVFVMENVKGLLSAKTQKSPVFPKILNDLKDPVRAYRSENISNGLELSCPGYRIYSLVVKPSRSDSDGNPLFENWDYVIRCERYGIPQTRHRVILLGIRNDINHQPSVLESNSEIPVSRVLKGLPKLRSKPSNSQNIQEEWRHITEKIKGRGVLNGISRTIVEEIYKQLDQLSNSQRGEGSEYISYGRTTVLYRPEWYLDSKIDGVCNHVSRGHMEEDLLRYIFVSCFGLVNKRSPRLEDFPSALLPKHKNVQEGIGQQKFADRFRVQLWDKPSKTITSHISKDGHYYIHPDPAQCRSLTVREAARIQSFPDNYYFCGPRTSQFVQVGNAVPPLLANQIASIVYDIFITVKGKNRSKASVSRPLLSR